MIFNIFKNKTAEKIASTINNQYEKIYSLAKKDKIGMNVIKMEFEDLCFKTLNKISYEKIKKDVNATKKQRQKFINKFIEPILPELKKYNIKAEPYGRAKHYFSIYKKVINKDKIVSELYDQKTYRL